MSATGLRGQPAWLRAVVVVAVVTAGLGAARVVATLGSDAPPAPATVTVSPRPADPTLLARPPWPVSADACGGSVELPLLSPQSLREPVGVRLLLGGKPRILDLDTGQTVPMPGLNLASDTYVAQVATAGPTTVLLAARCASGVDGRAVRLDDGEVSGGSTGPVSGLLTGGDSIAGVAYTDTGKNTPVASVDPLDGSPQMRMPPYFRPAAVVGANVVGVQYAAVPAGQAVTGFVRFLDLATGKTDPERTATVDAGATRGIIVRMPWLVSATPACATGGTCQVFRYDLRTGTRAAFSVAVPAGFAVGSGAVLSPDGTRVAFQHESATNPTAYVSSPPGRPQQVDVLDLRTGVIRPVSGVTLAPKERAGLVFSADSRRLIVAADEGTGTVVLVWRSGQAQRVRWVVTGPITGPPTVALAPP